MEPNVEQVKSSLGWLVSTFGGAIAGWFAAKGWFTIDDVLSVLNSQVFLAAAASIGVFIWRLFVHKQANAVAVVDAIAQQKDSPVKAIIVERTEAGAALAASLPGPTTVVAGTAGAQVAAKT